MASNVTNQAIKHHYDCKRMSKLKEVEVKIYHQAAQMASDDDIAKILELTPAQLARHRALIDRARAEAISSRKLGKTHQNVLVFIKGDPRAATQAIGPVEFGENSEENHE